MAQRHIRREAERKLRDAPRHPQQERVNPLNWMFRRGQEELNSELRNFAYRLSGLVRQVLSPVALGLAGGDKDIAMRAALPIAAITLNDEDMRNYMRAIFDAILAKGGEDSKKASAVLRCAMALDVAPLWYTTVPGQRDGRLLIRPEPLHLAAARLIEIAAARGRDDVDEMVDDLVREGVLFEQLAQTARQRGADLWTERARKRAERTRSDGENVVDFYGGSVDDGTCDVRVGMG